MGHPLFDAGPGWSGHWSLESRYPVPVRIRGRRGMIRAEVFLPPLAVHELGAPAGGGVAVVRVGGLELGTSSFGAGRGRGPVQREILCLRARTAEREAPRGDYENLLEHLLALLSGSPPRRYRPGRQGAGRVIAELAEELDWLAGCRDRLEREIAALFGSHPEGVRASVCEAEATGFMCQSGSRSPK
jgi:hypothetical protein